MHPTVHIPHPRPHLPLPPRSRQPPPHHHPPTHLQTRRSDSTGKEERCMSREGQRTPGNKHCVAGNAGRSHAFFNPSRRPGSRRPHRASQPTYARKTTADGSMAVKCVPSVRCVWLAWWLVVRWRGQRRLRILPWAILRRVGTARRSRGGGREHCTLAGQGGGEGRSVRWRWRRGRSVR